MPGDTPSPAPGASGAPRAKRAETKRANWRASRAWGITKRLLTLAFALLVLGLLVNYARAVDWSAVLSALGAMPARLLAIAAGLAAASYAVYCTYDLIGRLRTGHRLSVPKVMSVSFVSYAFNLNLGSLVGGVALRYRLYARLGLSTATTTQILGLSMLTNWLGYVWLAGGVFTLWPLELPPEWRIDSAVLQGLGAVLLVLPPVYVAACALSRRREWTLRGHTLSLPSWRLALVQLGLSSINWLLIASIIFTLLQGRIDYPTVLAVLLIAAVAGVITHVPAGLGVLEAVFVGLLSHRLPASELLAALLAYRAVYYLAPLVAALAVFAWTEARARKRTPGGRRKDANPRHSADISHTVPRSG